MKNPLRKRLPRELKGELGKYLVVFILMVLTIGMVSGFLVADGSMIVAYNDGFDKYNIENGNFRTNQQIYKSQKEEIQNLGIKLYENFYIEELLDNGSTMRFFKNRTEINGVCLMQGEFPKATGEIAIDRMYADNNELKVGDTLKSQSGKQTWKITGLVALSDYSCLFQNNNDSMFDSVKFGVSVVTPEEFDTLDQDKLASFVLQPHILSIHKRVSLMSSTSNGFLFKNCYGYCSILDNNLQGSSHRLKAVGFCL